MGQALRKLASAKINLCLHVTGQREDGYHLLDSVVVFSDFGDQLTLKPATAFSLDIQGPRSAGLHADENNLVLQAARQLHKIDPENFPGAEIVLEKNLPVASGIGGGSADAAATLHGLLDLFGQGSLSAENIAQVALSLGADVPVCFFGVPCRMRGIGENVDPVRELPECHLVLANPGVEVSTSYIFQALAGKFGSGIDEVPKTPFQDISTLCVWLKSQRNDLQAPAISYAPVIGEVLNVLAQTPGNLLARMSGSGATCFGFYTSSDEAQSAANLLKVMYPDWWVVASKTKPEQVL